MTLVNITIVAFSCVLGAFVLSMGDPTRRRTFGMNIWVLLMAYGPAVLSAIILPWWTVVIAWLATTMLHGFFRRSFGRKPLGSLVLDQAKTIVKVTEKLSATLQSHSSGDAELDISTYCLYVTARDLLNSGAKQDIYRETIGQLIQNISFYTNGNMSSMEIETRVSHFVIFQDMLGLDTSEKEYHEEMIRFIKRHYRLEIKAGMLQAVARELRANELSKAI